MRLSTEKIENFGLVTQFLFRIKKNETNVRYLLVRFKTFQV